MSINTFFYALAAGLIPSLFWLWFWLREDRLHPEPRSLIAGTFIGGAMAVFVAVFAEKWIADVVSDIAVRYTLWAAVEEILKFAAVAILALNSRHYDEPVDAMIYCVTVALGFAALENTLFILGPLSSGDLAQSIVTGNMRFIGATLVHTVSTGMVGCMLGLAFYRGWFVKSIALIIGLSAAIALHATFNLSIISAQPDDTLRAFGWVWGSVVLLIILFEEVKAVHDKKAVMKEAPAFAR